MMGIPCYAQLLSSQSNQIIPIKNQLGLPYHSVARTLMYLSGAENFLESQVENTVTVTRENSIRESNCCRFFIEAEAGGGLRRGKGTKLGSGRL
jgi:hypothetical protein